MSSFQLSFFTISNSCIPFVIIILFWLLIIVIAPSLSLYLVGK